MNMDAATWKTVAQIAIFCGAFLVAGGTLVSYFVGARADADKDLESKRRHDDLQGRFDSVDAQNQAMAARLSPFEELARQRFPALDMEESLKRLREDMSRVRELATRDLPRRLAADIDGKVVANLHALLRQRRLPRITINAGNIGIANVRRVFESLVHLLDSAGAPYRVGSTAEMLMIAGGPGAPYRLVARTGEEPIARGVAEALQPFIKSSAEISSANDLPAGTVVLNFQPQNIDFHEDGSVELR